MARYPFPYFIYLPDRIKSSFSNIVMAKLTPSSDPYVSLNIF